MGALKGREVKRICSIPHCRSVDTLILTRAADYGAHNNIYICKDCAAELWALYHGDSTTETTTTVAKETTADIEVKPNSTPTRKPTARKRK